MATEETKEENTKQIYVGKIPKKTKQEDVEKLFAEFGATCELFKGSYAFFKCENDKVEELTGKEYKIGEDALEVNVAREKGSVIKYFLDSRMTKGTLSELTEDQVKEYFSQFGEVVKCQILEKKGFGFLEMLKEEGNDEVDGLAWKKHEIEGHEINVKEQEEQRGRKRKRGQRGRGRGRRGRGRYGRNKRFKKNS